jgi:sodium transport system permease protein
MRDTRTLVLSVLLPVLILPLLLFAIHRFGQKRLGGAAGEEFSYSQSEPTRGLEALCQSVLSKTAFKEISVQNTGEMLRDGTLDLVVKAARPEKQDETLARDIVSVFPGLDGLAPAERPGRPLVQLLYRGDRDRSVRAYLAAQDRLLEFREELVASYFAGQKEHVGWDLQTRDVSSPQDREARRYGPALAAFMVLILLGGGSVAALDSLAGERERGTLSTLFLSSLDRSSILWSKFCAVAIISVAVACIQIANLAIYAALGWMKLPVRMGIGEGTAILASLALLFLCEALFTASLLLHISARSGSFKEAQLFFFPVFLISFALSLAGMMPGLGSHSVISLIPLAGPGVLIPEILASRISLPILLLQMAVHLLAAWLLLRSTLAYVGREEFLGGQPPVVGEALRFQQLSQRALPFYAFLAALLMVVPSNFAWLSTLAGQGVFNQVILFGAGPLLLLRLFGQRPARALPLRRVSLPVLVCCLALIPLGQIAATGFSHLLGPLLPPPVKAMQEMMEFLNVKNTPAWQIYLLVGLMPGIFEELAFRGVLLHALHRRFEPWSLAAVVALVFGMFHLTFYRVLPTAYLGFFLGLVTLATGNILPAMLVHVGNNSLAVFAMVNDWDFEGLGAFTYAVCFLAQLAATAGILRWGRGYPGTRWDKEALSRPEDRTEL